MIRNRLRSGTAIAAVVALVTLIAGCTSGESGDDTASTATTAAAEGSAPAATGPSPGVTDDTIKVGVTHVDTASLVASGLNYDLGDYQAVYQALFDDINADGGINGRQIEVVFAPIDPTSPAPAEAKCVELTEDEDVFVITGFFLNDAVVCPLGTHDTAVVGGAMTPERIEQAAAPWATWLPDTDQPEAVVRLFADEGALDGEVGVFAHALDQEVLDTTILPTLDELGIEPVETAVATSPSDDVAALQSEITTIGERFDASGVDTVLSVGASGQDWPTYMGADESYRPQVLFTEWTGLTAFATNEATTDTSVLEGALVGGGYGPDQARFEEATMQECIAVLDDAGLETPAPEDAGDDPSNQPYQAAFQACPDVALLAAVLEAAGADLNYGTFEAALDGLQVTLPGDPTERTYGPPPAGDGDPTPYLFAWDEDAGELVLAEG